MGVTPATPLLLPTNCHEQLCRLATYGDELEDEDDEDEDELLEDDELLLLLDDEDEDDELDEDDDEDDDDDDGAYIPCWYAPQLLTVNVPQ